MKRRKISRYGKKWLARKITSYVIALFIVIEGVKLVFCHFFDMTPYRAYIGVMMIGIGVILWNKFFNEKFSQYMRAKRFRRWKRK